MAHLLISSFDPLGRREWAVPLDRDEVTIGRAVESLVRLSDPKVSGRHARITRAQEGWLLVDTGSSNGTWRDGRRVTEHVLRDGDTIRLGDSAFRFLLAEAPAGTIPLPPPVPTSVAPSPPPLPDFGPTLRVEEPGPRPAAPTVPPEPVPGPDRTRILVALAVIALGGGLLLAVLYLAWRSVVR